MRILIAILLAIIISLSSCEKGEIPIQPHDRGDVILKQVESSTYAHQLYFDLETNEFITVVDKTIWDLGLGCGDFGELIFCNTSRSVAVARVSNGNFGEIQSISDLEFVYESSTGHPDSTAFHQWTINDVYVIDLGYDYLGNHQGYGKLQIVEVDKDKWSIAYGYLADSISSTTTINKDSTYNAIFFSFKTGNTVIVEPPKTDWDLCFTQYIHYFHEEETAYLVTGVLSNRWEITAYEHASTDFSNISFTDIEPDNFSTNMDVIGYDWKVYTDGNYIVYPNHNFIIKSVEGFYYKLHFINFYNGLGERGYPEFEFQQL